MMKQTADLSLYDRVVAGNEDAVNEMIEENMPLVTWKLNQFLMQVPQGEYLKDDLYSAGNLALVDAANKIADGALDDESNLSAYLESSIYRAFRDTLTDEPQVGPSSRTVRRHLDDDDFDPPQCIEISELTEEEEPYYHEPTPEFEIMEEIFACCHSERDRQIVTLRAEGLKDREIASKLMTSEPTVRKARHEIERRYQERDNA